ncbi:MarR family transcriptional regulator [Alkalicella caledoniensis]|uniref:MarR family transcriptional regulator n=1 Tax=Alkalicella caledoniensis TaxID=2731377 RepID=A0A7G9W7K5_ALKCA|nr:MarR family transcriptional regulator [Alkalicella caledoniensis]QNO14667.1 MarR family transcriptional regulator [Alkalicella caledoniensis]
MELKPDCCIDEVGKMVQHLVRVMQLFERDQIKPHGFTSSQSYILIELKKSKQLTMNELSEKMNVTTSTMTRLINNLVRDKYVERYKDEDDRRIVLVRLTQGGIEVAEKLELAISDYYRRIVDSLPEGQIDDVLRSVSLLIKAFDKVNPNCC